MLFLCPLVSEKFKRVGLFLHKALGVFYNLITNCKCWGLAISQVDGTWKCFGSLSLASYLKRWSKVINLSVRCHTHAQHTHKHTHKVNNNRIKLEICSQLDCHFKKFDNICFLDSALDKGLCNWVFLAIFIGLFEKTELMLCPQVMPLGVRPSIHKLFHFRITPPTGYIRSSWNLIYN